MEKLISDYELSLVHCNDCKCRPLVLATEDEAFFRVQCPSCKKATGMYRIKQDALQVWNVINPPKWC